MEYYFDDPTDDTDSADIPKVAMPASSQVNSMQADAYSKSTSSSGRDSMGAHPRISRPLSVRKWRQRPGHQRAGT